MNSYSTIEYSFRKRTYSNFEFYSYSLGTLWEWLVENKIKPLKQSEWLQSLIIMKYCNWQPASRVGNFSSLICLIDFASPPGGDFSIEIAPRLVNCTMLVSSVWVRILWMTAQLIFWRLIDMPPTGVYVHWTTALIDPTTTDNGRLRRGRRRKASVYEAEAAGAQAERQGALRRRRSAAGDRSFVPVRKIML